MSKQTVAATLDRQLVARLDLVARETERKRSWIINKAVELYLEEMEDLDLAKQRLAEPRLSPTGVRKVLRVSR